MDAERLAGQERTLVLLILKVQDCRNPLCNLSYSVSQSDCNPTHAFLAYPTCKIGVFVRNSTASFHFLYSIFRVKVLCYP